MTAPAPAGPYAPTSELVGRAWLALAVPYVRVGDELPQPTDELMRTVGFIRTQVVGGSKDRDVPFRRPVLTAECWVAPTAEDAVRWNRAGRLAQWVMAAVDDPALMGRVVDLTAFGSYRPARVHTVIALGEPQRVDDPGNFARFDIPLTVNWTGV